MKLLRQLVMRVVLTLSANEGDEGMMQRQYDPQTHGCAPIQRPTAPSVFRWYLVRLRVVCVRACVGVMWVRFVDTPWASIDIRSARGERALP